MPNVSCTVAGTLPDGRSVHRWHMITAGGMSADVLTLGASLHSVRCPDADGRFADVVLSPALLADKLGAARYLGATIGRYANRIAHGRLPTPHGALRLSVNEGDNTLHGGLDGFDTRLWAALPFMAADRAGVRFRLVSPDGDQGFPGTFDLTEPRRIREALSASEEQLSLVGGFDHNWVLRRPDDRTLVRVAVLRHPGTGRRLECLTTEPGLQIYTGNHFSGSGKVSFGSGEGNSGFAPARYGAVAIETQHFPDSPRRSDYPSTWLRPGESYRSTSVFRFSADSGCVSETEGFSSA